MFNFSKKDALEIAQSVTSNTKPKIEERPAVSALNYAGAESIFTEVTNGKKFAGPELYIIGNILSEMLSLLAVIGKILLRMLIIMETKK